jgi:plasmid stabilization system protein ParE
VDRLVDHPRSGRIVPELGQETLRELVLGNYRIIYRLLDDVVRS